MDIPNGIWLEGMGERGENRLKKAWLKKRGSKIPDSRPQKMGCRKRVATVLCVGFRYQERRESKWVSRGTSDLEDRP